MKDEDKGEKEKGDVDDNEGDGEKELKSTKRCQ